MLPCSSDASLHPRNKLASEEQGSIRGTSSHPRNKQAPEEQASTWRLHKGAAFLVRGRGKDLTHVPAFALPHARSSYALGSAVQPLLLGRRLRPLHWADTAIGRGKHSCCASGACTAKVMGLSLSYIYIYIFLLLAHSKRVRMRVTINPTSESMPTPLPDHP